MLEDLQECIRISRERAETLSVSQPFTPTTEFWEEILKLYSQDNDDTIEVVNNSLVLTTPQKLSITISAQEIPRCAAVQPYVNATRQYESKLNELAQHLGCASRNSDSCGDKIFKKLPSPQWESELEAEHVAQIKSIIKSKLGLSNIEQERFLKFISNDRESKKSEDWLGISKTLERSDWRISAIPVMGQWLAAASSRRGELADALSKSDKLERLMAEAYAQPEAITPNDSHSLKSLIAGRNIIIYGAPGTGKSHKIDQQVRGESIVRTVFHPDTQNSDFFGCLKPRMIRDKISYEFSPGPFALALKAAYSSPEANHYLIIEEINRAPAAAVFGELFQLLDRKDDGHGTYSVDFPNLESKSWFQAEIGTEIKKILMPPNLSILATMNSADQGVYPLDTAFRRRWEQEYLPLYEGECPLGLIYITNKSGASNAIKWRNFAECLNDFLTNNLEVAEDRLLGLWFVRERELGGAIPAKILLYLWDDLLRHEGREQVFIREIKTFGQLDSAIKLDKPIFSDALLQMFEAKYESISSQSTSIAPSDAYVVSDETN